MQRPEENSSFNNISIPPGKRKQSDSNSSPSSTSSHSPHTSKESPTSAVKRLKILHPAGSTEPQMMRKASVTQHGLIDLTRPSQFQPHTGVKRLVIKNLRTSARKETDQYYVKTWAELDDALTSIFDGTQPSTPLEMLCRGVENTCRRGQSEQLTIHLKSRCKAYLEDQLLPVIEKDSGSSNIDALRTVYKYWTVWNEQSIAIRAIFSYLDRSYLLNTKDAVQLEDQGINQFRHTIFSKSKARGKSLGYRSITGMCDLVEDDRTGPSDLFDPVLLRNSILMVHIFGVYVKTFEPELLRISDTYFETFARERSTSPMPDYIAACDRLLAKEGLRCDTYNFDSTTKRSLLEKAQFTLIEQCSRVLLSTNGLAKLLDSNAMGSLKTLYRLLSLSKIQDKLKQPWETYIRSEGSYIVSDLERGDDMVIRLLELKKKLDLIIRDAFKKNEAFTYTLRESFSNFINDSKNLAPWGRNNSKVGEMIAKYIDLLLRGGLKAVPRSLASDAKDRDAAEKEGQSSTGDEEAELDRQLDHGLELFRFIEGKDVFEAFYKKDLARRLLMARSASQDAERNMLAKLKAECGYSFTFNLETMFKDQDMAREEMISYKQSLSNTSKTTMDLQVSVLSSSAWPVYPDIDVKLPEEVARHIEKYDKHYKNKHSGRKLMWKHALAHSIVKAEFNKGKKELLVSAFQAIVLVLFNDIGKDGNLSYADISAATGLVDGELERTLQSLACAKFRILTKHPKGREVNTTDTFTVNLGFTDPKYRIKINQIQLKETKEENKETLEKVYEDRQYETQAAIVRIMKARKTINHSLLVSEVIEQTRKRGKVEPGEIKKHIEKLLDKEYMERDGNSYTYLA